MTFARRVLSALKPDFGFFGGFLTKESLKASENMKKGEALAFRRKVYLMFREPNRAVAEGKTLYLFRAGVVGK